MLYFKSARTGEVFAYQTEAERDQYGAAELVALTAAEVQAHRNPPPSAEQLQAAFTAAIQQRLDAFAQTRGYDGILSACTYATSAVPKFQAEGQTCVDVRDATWTTAYAILADVQAGGPMPTMDQVMAELPALEWPT